MLVFGVVLVLSRLQGAFGDDCSLVGNSECVKTVAEPYYQKVCSKTVECSKIVVPCGPPENLTTCNYDEVCVQYAINCKNSTKKPTSNTSDESTSCSVRYRCEWRPFWAVDLDLFSVNCTEYYILKEKETCGDAMTKFILPWRVFSGFNPKLNCSKAKKGLKVCVHAAVHPTKPLCGGRRCKIGEDCTPSHCVWKPKFGDKCGARRCPLGYACKTSDGKICKAGSEAVAGELSFIIPDAESIETSVKQRSIRRLFAFNAQAKMKSPGGNSLGFYSDDCFHKLVL